MRSRRARYRGSATLRLTVIGILLSTGLQAGQAPDREQRENAKANIKQAIRNLQIGSGLAVSDLFSLRAAYGAAMKRLAENASCRALFDGLRLDGLQALSRNHYQPAQSPAERAHCQGGVAAATSVGQSRILICRRFKRLPRRSRVAVLIHEALHTAGLNEAPYDPDGMTSREITAMVKRACSL